MLVIISTASVFPQKKENPPHGKIFMEERKMVGERVLRPHFRGGHDEKLFHSRAIQLHLTGATAGHRQ